MLRLIVIPVALALTQTVGHARPLPTAGPGVPIAAGFVALQQEEEREPGPADLQEAIEIAEKRYGGRAAGAETVVRDGRRVHEIKLLSEGGIVRTVRIDPETGAIIIPQEQRRD